IVERLAGPALDGDAGRHPEVAVHVEAHAIAAAAFAEIVDKPLLGERAVGSDLEGPDLAIAARLGMAVDDVERLVVGTDGDAVGALDFFLGEDALDLPQFR